MTTKAFEPVDLIIQSWGELDRNGGRDLADYFTEAAVWDLGTTRFSSRREIRDAMTARAARGHRTTRHLVSNIEVLTRSDDRAVILSVLQLYGNDGEPPLAVPTPTAIGDSEDHLVRGDSGEWLIASRVFHAVFVDPDRFAPFAAPDGHRHG
ncbi:nuclear transport factor 2 family protein (plasmid) [Rhodococcus opacus]|uniref:nuclear transport factor 2 family protein n=1 Tax=Rhodococcus opacus TaxID=37919 RepID=UPI001FF6AD9F|nr:nuclear transport factor 2 family protein [Rhodococcus opacus]UOT08506.1 nuclear transport factor 2 family protein [Rhodococcus opacus]